MSNSIETNQMDYKILSFDLDNALYDNQPVITKAEEMSKNFLDEEFKKEGKSFDFEGFLSIRNGLMLSNDPLFENLTRMRKEALSRVCCVLSNGANVAEAALSLFLEHRSKVTILPEIKLMLAALSERYILVTASNGNCDIRQSSIGEYFDTFWSATMDIRAKPHPQMLERILSHYDVTARDILHIGDSIEKDGGCAKNAGADFYKLAPFDDGTFDSESVEMLKSRLLG